MTDKSPREWWIQNSKRAIPDQSFERAYESLPNGVGMFPFVHVIEHSAFEKMQFERDSLQLKLSMLELNREMEAVTNTKSIFRGEKIVQLLEACEQERDRYRAALSWTRDGIEHFVHDDDQWQVAHVAHLIKGIDEALNGNKAAVIKENDEVEWDTGDDPLNL